jgi:hypothetical protein
MTIKHNKLRNTGILFELLVRRIATDVLDGASDSFAVKLMQEHFHPKSELGKELQLYRVFFNTPTLSEGKALDMLDLIMARRKALNEKVLSTQKFNLIRDIKEHTDLKQFLNGRVPSYKVYASLYKLFESTDNVMELQDVVRSRFLVTEHLQGKLKEEQILKETSYTNSVKNADKEIRFLSYKILLEKFNDKYTGLNDNQKRLLREYINKGTDVEPFKKFLSEQSLQVANQLQILQRNITNNVTKIKLHEVVSQLKSIHQKPTVKENEMTALLIAYQLVEELEKTR